MSVSIVQQALLNVTRAAAGSVALRVRVTGDPEPALRLVRQVLEDAAGNSGVYSLGPADYLIVAPQTEAAKAARDAIATLLPGIDLVEFTFWELPGDRTALLELAGEATPSAPPAPPAVAPLLGLDKLIDTIPIGSVVRRNAVLELSEPGKLHVGPIRVGLRHEALRSALGPAGQDSDLAHHARDRIAARMLAALADDNGRRGILGPTPPRKLIAEIPAAALPPRAPALDAMAEAPSVTSDHSVFAALPLPVIADPGTLSQLRGALEAHGWGLALRGITAPLLTTAAIETVDADLLMLRWSPDLAGRGPAAAIRRLDPTRILLLGADEDDAVRWGLSQGIRLFGGNYPELVLAAARMGACPARSQCTRRQCISRGAASSPEGRDGCSERGLLSALLPGMETAA